MCFNVLYDISRRFLILRKFYTKVIIDAYLYSRKVHVVHCQIFKDLQIFDRFSRKSLISNIMKFLGVKADLLYVDEQTDMTS